VDGVSVRIQLLGQTGYPPWPVQQRPLAQRYTDAPPATLVVPTRPALPPGRQSRGATAPRHATCSTFGRLPVSTLSIPRRRPCSRSTVQRTSLRTRSSL
jgi:hypothetical protein